MNPALRHLPETLDERPELVHSRVGDGAHRRRVPVHGIRHDDVRLGSHPIAVHEIQNRVRHGIGTEVGRIERRPAGEGREGRRDRGGGAGGRRREAGGGGGEHIIIRLGC